MVCVPVFVHFFSHQKIGNKIVYEGDSGLVSAIWSILTFFVPLIMTLLCASVLFCVCYMWTCLMLCFEHVAH